MIAAQFTLSRGGVYKIKMGFFFNIMQSILFKKISKISIICTFTMDTNTFLNPTVSCHKSSRLHQVFENEL